MKMRLRKGRPRDWWNWLGPGVALMMALLTIGLSGCSPAAPSAAQAGKAATATSNAPAEAVTSNTRAAIPAAASVAKAAGERVPKSLADAGEDGENIYDYAKANNWKSADAKLAALRDAVKRVRADVANQGPTADRLDGNVAALAGAVSAKDRQAAMREANQVTLNVAEMTTAYKLSVPVEVTRLDYYGRELEVWAQAEDMSKLQATAGEMRRTWDALRPSVEARNAAEAKKFGALVAQVEGARTAADYAQAAKPVLDEVDNLEKIFDRRA